MNARDPDSFVQELIDGLCKDIYVWRMARSRIGSGAGDAQLRSAVTRMRNAEKRIREIAFAAVEREQVRMAVED